MLYRTRVVLAMHLVVFLMKHATIRGWVVVFWDNLSYSLRCYAPAAS